MGKLIGSLEKQLTVEGEEINGYMDKMRRCSERGDLLSELLHSWVGTRRERTRGEAVLAGGT